MKKILTLTLALLLILMAFSACSPAVGSSASSGYEDAKITVEGLPGGDASITIAELRGMEQHDLDASYKRTTGLFEEFKMRGVYVSDVLTKLGANISDYEGIGVTGTDGYYCLVSRDVIESTPDLMLALEIDGESTLPEDKAPAQLAAQGQFGPYWVKMVSSITLYTEIPEKFIKNVWVFDNLAEGIEPYALDYYGSQDNSIDMEQIWARLENVDTSAFFTMKSSDGFQKSEAMNMVLKRYYIKTDGEDAPTNISPYIKLGMNVQHISWCSSNEDAMVFPEELMKYMTTKDIGGNTGIPLDELLYECGVEQLSGVSFEAVGMDGTTVSLSGDELQNGILCAGKDGSYPVYFEDGSSISDLLRVRMSGDKPAASESPTALIDIPKGDSDEAILSISGNGVERELSLSLSQLKAMTDGYAESAYSLLNNWPTEKKAAAKGIALGYLLKNAAGIKSDAALITLTSSDGFLANFLPDQLLGERKDLSTGKSVPPILAWECAETDDLAKTEPCSLRNFYGQTCETECNTVGSVQDITSITVTCEQPDPWDQPFYEIADKSGKKLITLSHEYIDAVKIYYTTDGSEPTTQSKLYNPSTTYFQPDLTVPIEADPGSTVKIIVTGNGRADSAVLDIAC